jgi:hypothetical protein
MSGAIIVFFFGFPAAFLSLLVSVIGVLKEKYWLVLIGAVLFIPFAYYLSGSPGTYGLPILLLLFQVLSAAAVREKSRHWAWILLLPSLLAVLWVVAAALFYQLR